MRLALAYNLKRSHIEAEAEFDTPETIAAIRACLTGLGHEVVEVEVSGPLPDLIARLLAARADLVFNLAEGTVGRFREAFYPALYEQLGLPYTGSDPGAMALAMDKGLTKTLLARLPGFRAPASVRLRTESEPLDLSALRFPLIVKPNDEGSSKGITQRSVVEDERQLHEVARDLVRQYPGGVLVEDFIDGDDVSVAWVDGLAPDTRGILAPARYLYQPSGKYRLYDLSLKRTQHAVVAAEVPARLGADVLAHLVTLSQAVFRELGITAYGRADYRVTPAGEVYFLEMNPLPSLAPDPDAEMYQAVALRGQEPADVFAAILRAARRRFGLV